MPMRITEIEIARLFGLFDHTIRMNSEERVTIIHGPNGYGKTTILGLIDNLFAGRYSEVTKIFFRDFRIAFDTGQFLEVVRVDARTKTAPKAGPDLHVSLRRGEKVEAKTTLSPVSPEALEFNLPPVEHLIPHIRRMGRLQWRNLKTGEILGVEEIIRLTAKFMPPSLLERVGFTPEPDWLRTFREGVPVRFIQSQRLLRVSKGQAPQEDAEPVRPAVLVYSSELAKLIQGKLAEYATLSQSLDRSFPKRLVEQARSRGKERSSIEGLREKLQQLEDKRESLTESGLLEEGEAFDLGSYLTEPNLTETVLPVYAKDAEEKLDVFKDIAPKIELLKSIVNAHFQFKVMSISKEKGFEFETSYPGSTSKPRPLSTAQLSSGEQHMLVLLYELLFKVQPNSLILIDEPEISLHVAWQLQLLSDIQRITELSTIDVLIATHAPGIISDRLDLTVELKAPAEA